MRKPIIFAILFFVAVIGLGCVSNDNQDDVDGGNNGLPPGYRCPTTSLDTDTPCGTVQEGGAAVSGIYVPLACLCPSDTYDYESNFVVGDMEYRTCVCLE